MPISNYVLIGKGRKKERKEERERKKRKREKKNDTELKRFIKTTSKKCN